MSSYYREQMEAWLKTIEVKDVDVLDIGGLQLPLSGKRLKTFEPKDYIIMDIDDGADVRFNINNPKRFEEVFEFRSKKFDVVFCLEVFEYIYNPIQAMMNIAEYLKEGSTAYISFPFVYPIHNPQGTDMLRYTENWIKCVMDAYGFKDLEITTRQARNPDALMSFYLNDGMRSQKDFDHNVIGYLVKGVKK